MMPFKAMEAGWSHITHMSQKTNWRWSLWKLVMRGIVHCSWIGFIQQYPEFSALIMASSASPTKKIFGYVLFVCSILCKFFRVKFLTINTFCLLICIRNFLDKLLILCECWNATLLDVANKKKTSYNMVQSSVRSQLSTTPTTESISLKWTSSWTPII